MKSLKANLIAIVYALLAAGGAYYIACQYLEYRQSALLAEAAEAKALSEVPRHAPPKVEKYLPPAEISFPVY